VWETRFGSLIRKGILATLNYHHGEPVPLATIAAKAEASVRATQINLRWLEQAGAITVVRRYGPGAANTYFLNVGWKPEGQP
jgi:hypothetical protein